MNFKNYLNFRKSTARFDKALTPSSILASSTKKDGVWCEGASLSSIFNGVPPRKK
jgi:hypothetical protein